LAIFLKEKGMWRVGLKASKITLREWILLDTVSYNKSFRKNIVISFSKKRCFGTKNLEICGLNLVTETVPFSTPKLLSVGKKLKFTHSSSLMVFGPLIVTSSKMKHTNISKISSPTANLTIAATSILAHTPSLMC